MKQLAHLAIALVIATFTLPALANDWPIQTTQHATVIPLDATHAYTELLNAFADTNRIYGTLTDEFLSVIDYYNHCGKHEPSCYVLLNFDQNPQRATIYQDPDGTPKLAWQLSLPKPQQSFWVDKTISTPTDPSDPPINTLDDEEPDEPCIQPGDTYTVTEQIYCHCAPTEGGWIQMVSITVDVTYDCSSGREITRSLPETSQGRVPTGGTCWCN